MTITGTPSIDSLTVDQALQQAINLHRAGDLQEAERLYRDILQAQPQHPDANHNLGILAVQRKQPATGLPHFKVALEANPNQGQYWLSYTDALIQTGQMEVAQKVLAQGRQRGLQGEAVDAMLRRWDGPSSGQIKTLVSLFNQGRYTEGEALAQRLTLRFPHDGFAWKVLGAMLKLQGRSAEALEPMQKAIELLPRDAEALNNLGAALKDQGQLTEAEASYRRSLEIKPDFAEAHNNLGVTLNDQGRLTEAETSYRRSLEIEPDYAEAHSNLGVALKEMDRLTEAETSFRRALEIKPDYAEVHNNLGNVLKEQGRLTKAEASYRRSLEIKPDYAEALNNLGNVLKEQGRLTEAEASYRRSLEIKPDDAEVHSNLLFTLNYAASHHHSYHLKEACRYGQMVAKKVGIRFSAWQCMPRPERLRVGLVSGDLRNHPVGYFLESVLAQVNSSRIELIAYPADNKEDELTARIKAYFSDWKSLVGLSDEAAAGLIHADGVHILMDLSGHTTKNRLPMFAWKPAPVQVSWLGFLATTGVHEIDYVLGDPQVTPLEDEGNYSEKVWRLPETFCCFTPPDVKLEVGPLPALSAGLITFGCFNHLSKMTEAVVALWARVLKAVPGSRLFLKTRQLNDPTIRETTGKRFAAQGIGFGQLLLEGASPRAELLAAYQRVDIALDPFPYNGGTTSAESLWMAVPFITRKGDRFLSRCGQSLVGNAGLVDWIAENDDNYVAKAVMHTTNLERLSTLRITLRQQVLASPLFDAPRFARNFEAALWGMWETWRG